MKQAAFATIRIGGLPGRRSLGILRAGALVFPVALGRSGIRADKREGDGSTPRGEFRPLRVWWRPDHGPRPRTLLPVRRIGRADAWCENPRDRRYNRCFRRSANEPGDRLWRDDHLYDLIIEINHNIQPRIAGRGSAVFMHLARPAYAPTAGCIALSSRHLRALLNRIDARTRILIHP